MKKQSDEQKNAQKTWTIMIYFAGDNNLTEEMIAQLKSLEKLKKNRNIKIVAVYDSAFPPFPVQIYDFTQVTASSRPSFGRFAIPMTSQVLGSPNSESFGIDRFVKWVLKQPKFKSNYYSLILSGHSDGIIGRTILRDENPPLVFDVKALFRVLERARKLLPTRHGMAKKFDILGFDGCLMSMFEVAYELKSIANIMVASEGNIPGSGWNYQEIFKKITKIRENRPTLSAEQFAKEIVCKYADFNRDFILGGRSIDAAALNLNNIDLPAKQINDLAKHFLFILNLKSTTESKIEKDILQAQSNAFIKNLFVNLILLSHYRSQTYMHEQATDIRDFICNFNTQVRLKSYEIEEILLPIIESFLLLTPPPAVPTSTLATLSLTGFITERLGISETKAEIDKSFEDLSASLNDYVIAHSFAGSEYQFSKGASIFFPWTEMSLNLLFKKYSELNFSIDYPNWLKFIDKFTYLTLRSNRSRLICPADPFKKFDSTKYANFDLAPKQHGDRQHGDRQHGDRGQLESFFRFLGQVRNYSVEQVYPPSTPPKPNDFDLWDCVK